MPFAPFALDADWIVLTRRRKLGQQEIGTDDLGLPGVGTVTNRVGQGSRLKIDPQLRKIEEVGQRNRRHAEATPGLGPRTEFEKRRACSGGRIGASPGKGDVAVSVESSGSTAVAEASTGSFAVFNDGKGLVAVVAEAGEVKLTSAGGDTVLAAGQGARVEGDAAPVREAVPRSVLLKVAWPAEKVTRQATVTLRGEADPGAFVSVNGRELSVGEDGRFETEVPLALGANKIAVRSVDRFGRVADDAETVRVDRRPPPVKARSEGWQ